MSSVPALPQVGHTDSCIFELEKSARLVGQLTGSEHDKGFPRCQRPGCRRSGAPPITYGLARPKSRSPPGSVLSAGLGAESRAGRCRARGHLLAGQRWLSTHGSSPTLSAARNACRLLRQPISQTLPTNPRAARSRCTSSLACCRRPVTTSEARPAS